MGCQSWAGHLPDSALLQPQPMLEGAQGHQHGHFSPRTGRSPRLDRVACRGSSEDGRLVHWEPWGVAGGCFRHAYLQVPGGRGGGARGGGLPCHRVTPCWASRCWPFSPERKRLGPAGPVGVDRRWGRSFRLPGPGRWWAGRPASGLRVSRCRRRSAGPTCCLSQPSRPHCALRLGRTHLPFLCPPVPSTSVHLLGPGSERL